MDDEEVEEYLRDLVEDSIEAQQSAADSLKSIAESLKIVVAKLENVYE